MNQPTSIAPRARKVSSGFQMQEAAQRERVALTVREQEILQWSAAGKSSWEIARIFNCSEAGVNYHFCNIRRKFGVSSRWAAVVKALAQGLIQLP
jgi:LuxR family quorum-sensing transcriptional regulator LasR